MVEVVEHNAFLLVVELVVLDLHSEYQDKMVE
jgi:hypothetical protein